MEDEAIQLAVRAVAAALEQHGWRLATAESCTGGWVAKACTDLAGSSNWFERGYVTYSNEAKSEELGVPSRAILEHGAVSREVAVQMAAGACRPERVQVGLSVTGIAGPDGGSADKPVGTVWFAWTLPDTPTVSECKKFTGSRADVRRQSVIHALDRLNDLLV